jgi:hypothetical protein
MEDQVLDAQGVAPLDLGHEGLAASRQGFDIGARQVDEIGAVGDDPRQAALREGVPERLDLVGCEGPGLPLELAAREDLDGFGADRLAPLRRVARPPAVGTWAPSRPVTSGQGSAPPPRQEEAAVFLGHVLEEDLVGRPGEDGPRPPPAHGALEAAGGLAHPQGGRRHALLAAVVQDDAGRAALAVEAELGGLEGGPLHDDGHAPLTVHDEGFAVLEEEVRLQVDETAVVDDRELTDAPGAVREHAQSLRDHPRAGHEANYRGPL